MPHKTRFATVISFSLARGWGAGFEEWARDRYVRKKPTLSQQVRCTLRMERKVGAVSEDRMAG